MPSYTTGPACVQNPWQWHQGFDHGHCLVAHWPMKTLCKTFCGFCVPYFKEYYTLPRVSKIQAMGCQQTEHKKQLCPTLLVSGKSWVFFFVFCFSHRWPQWKQHIDADSATFVLWQMVTSSCPSLHILGLAIYQGSAVALGNQLWIFHYF